MTALRHLIALSARTIRAAGRHRQPGMRARGEHHPRAIRAVDQTPLFVRSSYEQNKAGLVVDDEPFMRTTIKVMLRMIDRSVVTEA